MEVVSRARIEVEAMRLMVLRAAKAMDTLGNAEARVWVSAVKAMVPQKCCDIIDDAIQMHGAAGFSQWFPLADMWHHARALRIIDGPDEVHHHVVARAEVMNRQSALAGDHEGVGRSAQTNRTVEGRVTMEIWLASRRPAAGRRSGASGLLGQGSCVT